MVNNNIIMSAQLQTEVEKNEKQINIDSILLFDFRINHIRGYYNQYSVYVLYEFTDTT